jgi:hypothetical protein
MGLHNYAQLCPLATANRPTKEINETVEQSGVAKYVLEPRLPW